MSQERGITYLNTIVPLKVLYNGDTSRGNKGIKGYNTLFPLKAPNVYSFDFGRPLIFHSISVLLPLSSLASTV